MDCLIKDCNTPDEGDYTASLTEKNPWLLRMLMVVTVMRFFSRRFWLHDLGEIAALRYASFAMTLIFVLFLFEQSRGGVETLAKTAKIVS